MQTIYIINLSILSILVFLLAIKSKKTDADKYLIAFFICIIFGVFNDVLALMLPQYKTVFSFGGIAVPLGAAFIFLYIDALISHKTLQLYSRILVFLPTVIVLVFLFFNSEYYIVSSNNMLLITGYFLFKMGMPLVFIILSSYRLRQHKKGLKNEFSYTENIDFKWLKVLIDSSLILLAIAFLSFTLYRFNIITSLTILVYFTNIALFIFILFLAFYGIKNTHTFRDIISESDLHPEGSSSSREVSGATEILNEFVKKHVIEKLESTIDSEKPYLSEKLTISKLSMLSNIPHKQLSQLLNNHYKKTFFDYINTLRIDEFNKRIKQGDNQKFTILSIAYDCGFSSKSAFNRAYKKHVGVPPSAFVKSGTFS
ncbi:MAG: AraC family transcriptional regulator [Bacteroidales bacterium]|nr:AraC family transcriptional regulator [Bacteroidales bacterium]MCF8345942.1 AraC family transcriptional regulator [Bacteroidales bacterium]